MAEARSMLIFGETDTGLAIGDLTFNFIKTIDDGTTVSATGSTLVELGRGFYTLMNPNIVEDTLFSVYITADSTKVCEGIFAIDTDEGYSGKIWIDSTNGVAGTQPSYNGISNRPVASWTDALSLAQALDIYQFNIAPGTTITPTGSCAGYIFTGKGWTLDLNGQDYSNAFITGCKSVSGAGTSTV